jgi:cytochrome b561
MNATTHAVTAPAAVFPRYDRVQRILHWSMAAIIMVAVAIGLYCSFLVPGTPTRKMLLDVHKSLGMTALVLALIRIGYRLLVSPPAYLEPLGRLTRAGASSAHLLLYGLMLFMPVTGYVFSAAGGYPLPWFGLFQWPRVLPADKALAHWGQMLHGWGAWAIYLVLALHVAAVVWHQWIRKDAVLARMMPRRA